MMLAVTQNTPLNPDSEPYETRNRSPFETARRNGMSLPADKTRLLGFQSSSISLAGPAFPFTSAHLTALPIHLTHVPPLT